MKKKGFTLIEIIIVIALLAVVGTSTSVAVIKINDKKEKNILIENEEKFKNAIDVYLSNHSEVINNINNNAEGAVISLEVLKNEGLIDDKLGINYKENYYIVSNALLLDTLPSDLDGKCEDSVSLEIIANWQEKEDSSKVLYFCNSKNSTVPNAGSQITDEIIDDGVIIDKDSGNIVGVINDPKEACKNGVLSNESLVCKVINSAINESKNSSNILYGVEKDDEVKTINLDSNSAKESLNYGKNDRTIYKELPLTNVGDSIKTIAKTNYTSYKEYIYEITEYPNEERKSYLFANANLNSYITEISYSDKVKIDLVGNRRVLELDGDIKTIDNSDRYKTAVDIFVDESFNNKDNMQDKYVMMYDSNSNSSFIVKILNIETDSTTSGYWKFQKKVTYKYKVYEPEDVITTWKTDYYDDFIYEKSLSRTSDDYGYSYYFRGDVSDNYVTLNNMCWRIVRIQGDGSVKLILSSDKGPCNEYNLEHGVSNLGNVFYGGIYDGAGDEGHLNYEFGNGCRYSDNFSIGLSVLPDSLKERMEMWFDSKSFDVTKIKKERICLGIDERIYGEMTYNNSSTYNRIKPIVTNDLKCEENLAKTSPKYIFPITIEEAIYAGIGNSSVSNSYLIGGNILYSNIISNTRKYPSFFTISIKDSKEAYIVNSNGEKDILFTISCSHSASARPAIVLKANVLVTGSGTIDDPYVVE